MKFNVEVIKKGETGKGKTWLLVKATSQNLSFVGFARGSLVDALNRDGVVESDNVFVEVGQTVTVSLKEG